MTLLHKIATISRSNQVTVNYGARHMKQKIYIPTNPKQKPSQYRPKWQLSLLKTVLSILLPYLLSPPDISIHIYHINIIF
jgi:hypothetical protein